jgi:predicted permease
MFRSFQTLRSQDPGFDVEGILTARLTLPSAESPTWQETAGFFRQLQERMLAQPGVSKVGLAQPAPLTGGMAYVTVGVEDHPRGPEEMPIFSSQMSVAGEYFEAMEIDVLTGRSFRPGDGAEGVRAVVISQSFANHWWPETNPLGRRIGDGGPEGEDWWEIVGVVADVTHQNLQADPEELIYFPMTRGPADSPGAVRSMDILIRTSGDPLLLIPILRRELKALNPRVPLSNPRTMEEVFRLATAPMAVTMTMLGAASGIALLLGLIGIYGVISYLVSQRTREIGVRMALGASAPLVRGMVVKQGLGLAVGGVALGLIGAGLLSTLMSSLLFGVGSLDPLTYVSVSAGLVAVSAFASWLPARRAAAVDPSTALRED